MLSFAGIATPAVSISPKLPALRAAVIVPGFLSDESDFYELAEALSADGIATAVVPMKLWHWIPILGGRSVRPLLDRIAHAVEHVAALGPAAEVGPAPVRLCVPTPEYSALDCWNDFTANPGGVLKAGGTDQPDEYPDVEPAGTFPRAPPPKARVALIGHSAGGYAARIFLSDRAYGGRAYGGRKLVHSLVTLGTPHVAGAGVPFYSVAWANREEPGVRTLAVGATGTPGATSGDLTKGAYSFCEPSGTGGEALDGDGVTTTASATTLAGAETLILDGTTHYPWTAPGPVADVVAPELTKAYREGKPWYGSDGPRSEWVRWLKEGL